MSQHWVEQLHGKEIAQLPEWESELLMSVQISNNKFAAVDSMTTTSFIIATDRSADEESMLFGWKISTVREEVVATHACPALGDPSSF
eukprot:1858768-Ditylum_brightwellii.AAC.1